MSNMYRVGKYSALKFRGVIVKPGTRIAKDDALDFMGQKEIDRLRGMGVLVEADQQYEQPDDPNIANQKPLPPIMDTRPDKPEPAPMVTAERGPRDTTPVETVIKTKYASWTLDPATLQGKDIAELNVMIVERTNPKQTDKAESFETIEEAIAWLSQDFITGDEPAVATAS